MYEAKVRKSKGPWENPVKGKTLREVKRALGKKAGLPVRVVDQLPLGRSTLGLNQDQWQWAEALVKAVT